MKLPKTIPLQNAVFGDGANGYAFQIQRNDEYGVQVKAVRARHGAPWSETYTSDFLPDKEFKSYAELRQELKFSKTTPPTITILTVEKKDPRSLGKCWLCRGNWDHTVRVKTGWRGADVTHIPCCDADLEKVKADPLAAIDARHKQVSGSADGIEERAAK